MADFKVAIGDDVRGIMSKKPEIMERLIGITIDRDTLKAEHWIDVHPGRQKIDFVFQDTEGKHYVIKVAKGERFLNAVRMPNIWQRRWAEIHNIDIEQVVPVLLVDEETVGSSPRNQQDLDAFSHITTIQYKAADIEKEL